MTEIWRAIPDHHGYEASTHGRIRSVDRIIERHRSEGICLVHRHGVILKPAPDQDGYLMVQLGRGNGRKVHHLILETFIRPKPDGFEAAHGDGDRANNRLNNLSWVTHQENESHKVVHGTLPQGSAHGAALLREEDVLRIREAFLFGALSEALSSTHGVHRVTIFDITHRRTWRHL